MEELINKQTIDKETVQEVLKDIWEFYMSKPHEDEAERAIFKMITIIQEKYKVVRK